MCVKVCQIVAIMLIVGRATHGATSESENEGHNELELLAKGHHSLTHYHFSL